MLVQLGGEGGHATKRDQREPAEGSGDGHGDQCEVFGGFHEFLLLECNLMQTDLTGINQINAVSTQHPVSIYNMSGMKQNAIATGVNIIRQSDGKTVKIVKK